MRIKMFIKLVVEKHLNNHVLQDSTVVIDGLNFFYDLYKESGLQYIFGCECEKYAIYLRDYLSMFKKANIQCYFIFKGGHKDPVTRLTSFKNNEIDSQNFDINLKYDNIVFPIFMKEVYKQVLDEMGFAYTICQFDAKTELIALANMLGCPVISNDNEYCFSGIPYIVYSTLKFNEQCNKIECGIFSLDEFLKTYNLNENMLALFAALTDIQQFPENHFIGLFKKLKIQLSNFPRNYGLLRWLGKVTRNEALAYIFEHLTQDDKKKFLEVERKQRALIKKQVEPGIPAQYLLNGNKIEFTNNDQLWFEKGVASKHISLQLINLAHSGITEGNWTIADYTQNDAKLLALDIIKYSYNLLTDFKKENLIFFVNKQQIPVPVTNSIKKPDYVACCSPFENGWINLRGKFFEHFLNESLQRFDADELKKLPEDLRMLMVALIYFSEKKPQVNTRNEIVSFLLSYVALCGVTEDNQNNNLESNSLTSSKDIGDKIEKSSINDTDKLTAKAVLAKYLADVEITEARRMFNLKLLHPLVEFQHCLQQLNYLNVLCGKMLEPTMYSKTYNATFVYKVLYIITTEYSGNCIEFLKQTLSSAPSVLTFVEDLIDFYDSLTL